MFQSLVEHYGSVTSVTIREEQAEVWVEYVDARDAREAFAALKHTEFDGNSLHVRQNGDVCHAEMSHLQVPMASKTVRMSNQAISTVCCCCCRNVNQPRRVVS